jgi:hypothetical protein
MAKVIPLEELAYRRAIIRLRAEIAEIRSGKTGKLIPSSSCYMEELIKLLKLRKENCGRTT